MQKPLKGQGTVVPTGLVPRCARVICCSNISRCAPLVLGTHIGGMSILISECSARPQHASVTAVMSGVPIISTRLCARVVDAGPQEGSSYGHQVARLWVVHPSSTFFFVRLSAAFSTSFNFRLVNACLLCFASLPPLLSRCWLGDS